MLKLSTAVNWADAKRRVLKSYREWIRAVRYLPPCGCSAMCNALSLFLMPGELVTSCN